MKHFIKQVIAAPALFLLRSAELYARAAGFLTRRDVGALTIHKFTRRMDNRIRTVIHTKTGGGDVTLRFYTPNPACGFRADTFSVKEPLLLRWIDESPGAGPLWDIGANIGLYSVYWAKTKSADALAFEPSVFNLRQLAKNIFLNGLSEKIRVVPLPLADADGFNNFTLSSDEEGAALSMFGALGGAPAAAAAAPAAPAAPAAQYSMLGLTADKLLELGLPVPERVKIDVDGIEHLILKGMTGVLKSDTCRSVYVEVDEDFTEQADGVNKVLTACGFSLKEKSRDIFAPDPASNMFNQVWSKDA